MMGEEGAAGGIAPEGGAVGIEGVAVVVAAPPTDGVAEDTGALRSAAGEKRGPAMTSQITAKTWPRCVTTLVELALARRLAKG